MVAKPLDNTSFFTLFSLSLFIALYKRFTVCKEVVVATVGIKIVEFSHRHW